MKHPSRQPPEEIGVLARSNMRGLGRKRVPVSNGLKYSVAPGWRAFAGAALLGFGLVATGVSQQDTKQPTSVPDAPAPQAPGPIPLSDAAGGPIRPGGGTVREQPGGASTSGDLTGNPEPRATQPQQNVQQAPPVIPANSEELSNTIIRLTTTEVNVPVTVKDSKGNLVAGLTWRDFKVYENGNPVNLRVFSTDAVPLSMVFVVDQSLRSDVMAKVNESLGAVQGALTPYDEIAVFSYANGAHNQSGGFTGAQSARVPFVLSMTKASGTERLNPVNSGPLAGCSITQNGNCIDPNLQPGRSAGDQTFMTIPKEIHTLNDAVLAAAKELSTRPKERRRVIYVISDGKENGSKATYKEVLRYLQTNNIAVYGTLVGDSAQWGEGYLSRFHLPFTMYDNRLVSYVLQTGGTLDSEKNLNGIEKSYAAIAEEARTRYTLVYASHEPPVDSRFRTIDVRVNRPGLDVVAKKGYYPSAQDVR